MKLKIEKHMVIRWILYLTGLLVLSLGISLNTKTNLGVGPIVAFPFYLSELLHVKFADTTLFWYSLLSVAELVIHGFRKQYKAMPVDLLQILISIITTRFINLFVSALPNVAEGPMSGRLLFVLCAVLCTGIGAAVSLNARLAPNPGDGFVQAVSDASGKPVGFIKNVVDITLVLFTCLISWLTLGHISGVGLGTVCTSIGVGRVIAVFNHFALKPMQRVTGMAVTND